MYQRDIRDSKSIGLHMNDNKRLVKNSIYNIIYRCFSIVFPLITSIYVARILGATNLGKIDGAQNIVSYFLIFSAMGIPTYGVKLVAQYKPKTNDSSKAFIELWLINFILTIISCVVYYLLVFLVPFFSENRVLYIITGLSLVFNIFNVDWFYQGIQEYRFIAIRSIVIKILSFISLFVFVHSKEDYLIYALIIILGTFGNYVFNIIRLKKYIILKKYDLSFRTHINHILILFGAALAAEIYTLTDTTMLNVMCGPEVVAYYSMSLKIIRVLRGLVVAVSAVFLPQLSFSYHNGDIERFRELAGKGMHILAYLTIPLAIGLIICCDDLIVTFYSEEYLESVISTRILAVSIISIAFSNFIGLQLLLTLGKEKVTTWSTVFGAIINVLLNIILIIRLRHAGAAIASAITEIFVTIFQLVFCSKYLKIKIELIPIIISSIIMIPFVIIIHRLGIYVAVRLIMEALIGAGVYFLTTILLKDQFASQIRDYLLDKNRI